MRGRSKAEKSRVVIEAPTLDDRPAFLGAVHRSKRLHGTWVSPPATRAEYARFVARSKLSTRRTFLVRVRETGDIAGVVTLGDIIFGFFRGAFLGYYAFEPLREKATCRRGWRSCSTSRSRRSACIASR